MRILIFIMVLALTSCASVQKKQEKKEAKAKSFYLLNPEKLAELCDSEFPIPDIQYIPGDTIVKVVTKEIPGVEIVCPEPTPENPTPKVICPVCLEKTKTVYKTDTVRIKDTREVFLVQEELKRVNIKNESQSDLINSQKDEIRDLQNGRNNWRWMFIILAVAAGLFFGFKIFK